MTAVNKNHLKRAQNQFCALFCVKDIVSAYAQVWKISGHPYRLCQLSSF